MNALSAGLIGLSKPVLLVALIVLIFGALECERFWTRSRRRRGLEPGAVAFLLDGLVIIGIVLVLAVGASLFVAGITSTAAIIGGMIDGERGGLLIVGMALALGLALALTRAANRRQAAPASAGASAVGMPSIYPPVSAAEARLAGAEEQQLGYESPQEHIEEPLMAPLAMMQERWQPGAATAADVPTSFFDLAEPRAQARTRSRFALASTLLMLALMVSLISGIVLFRRPLGNVLAGMEASYSTADTSSGGSLGQAGTGAENAAAAVSAATASVVSAPTAASQPAPAALPPASDAQAVQKRVKSNGLNLRAQPGTDQQVVVVLKQGDTVMVFNDARLIHGATWVKVRAGDFEGWVDQSLLE